MSTCWNDNDIRNALTRIRKKTYQQHVTLSCFISNDAETSYLIDDLETKSPADETEGDKF